MYAQIKPNAVLEPVVEAFWHVEMRAGSRLILPDGCQDWVFEYRDALHVNLVGGMTLPRRLTVSDVRTFFGVRFHPGALGLLLGPLPMTMLSDKVIPLQDVLRLNRQTHDRLEEPPDSLAAFARIMTGEIMHLMRGIPSAQWQKMGWMRQVQEGQIEHLARRSGVSRRHFHRQFSALFGFSPRFYAKVMRFRRLETLLSSGRSHADSALMAGYYDQPHMCRDVRTLTGLSMPAWLNTLDVTNVQAVKPPRRLKSG